jgi:hypothetical protein
MTAKHWYAERAKKKLSGWINIAVGVVNFSSLINSIHNQSYPGKYFSLPIKDPVPSALLACISFAALRADVFQADARSFTR